MANAYLLVKQKKCRNIEGRIIGTSIKLQLPQPDAKYYRDFILENGDIVQKLLFIENDRWLL